MLLVGPESAGANPGPVCYKQGGQQVAVTDANVILGRIPGSTLLGGYLPLDVQAAEAEMAKLAADMGCGVLDAAKGVVRIANEHMARALRVISVELVNIRLGARAPAVLKSVDIKPKYDGSLRDNMIYMPELDAEVPIYHRGALKTGATMEGPMLLTESAATAWVQPGWMVEADQWGNVFLQLIE